MQRERWKYLLNRLHDQTASAAERMALMEALREAAPGEPDEELLDDLMAQHQTGQGLAPVAADILYDNIRAHLPTSTPSVKQLTVRGWWWAAAASLLLLGSVVYLVTQRQIPAPLATRKIIDVLPGGNKAILTLADGTHVVLDSSGKQLIQQGSTAISQNNGELKYEAKAAGPDISYNVLTTPRGGQFRLVLPDNSAVWLNAASSIRYPIAFAGNERKVEVTGEVYFEVAPMAGHPFRVSLPSGITVEVLGTHFNVNAYTEEKHIQTTLTDGRIQVIRGSDKIGLQPGQQALIDPGKAGISVRELTPAGITQVIAWKNGVFNFEQMDLEEVMQQLCRWYDIQVVYKGAIPHRVFGGELSRSLHLSDIVEVMHMMKVNVQIEEGRKLVIQPS